MNERELKLLPIGLSEQRQQELVREFQAKDFKGKDEYILSYVRLTRYIALKECYGQNALAKREDVIAVGFEALAKVPSEVATGRIGSKTLYKYTIARVRTRCRMYIRKDHVMYTPERSIRRGKRLFTKLQAAENNESGIYPYTDPVFAVIYSIEDHRYANGLKRKELVNELLRHAKTSLEHIVLSLHFSGYTDREIGQKLGSSVSLVERARRKFVERLREQVKLNADFLALP